MSVIYLMSDGENEWEVSEDEWLRTGTGQGFTSFSGPEYSGRRLAAEDNWLEGLARAGERAWAAKSTTLLSKRQP